MAEAAPPMAAAVPSASAAAAAAMDNTSAWFNFTTMWPVASYLNMTKLAPSFEDLVLAGPRMVMKLGRLGSLISIPDAIDGFGQRIIPDATPDSSIIFAATTTTSPGTYGFGSNYAVASGAGAAAQSVAGAAAAAAAAASQDQDPVAAATAAASSPRFTLEGARGLGSVFSYATSKWALCCIAMAVVLNRTHIFAATRRRLRLRWPVRLALRLVPIVLLVIQARQLLQSIQCQTSADFAEMRWGNASKSSDLMFSQSSAFLHGLSSGLLLGASDRRSCLAVRMIPAAGQTAGDQQHQPADLRGSLSLLWPLFGSFCLSQFLETISCAVQGRPIASETGMTLFEHSLAFAEADAAISNQLGWGMFTNAATAVTTTAASAAAAPNAPSPAAIGANIAITRSMIMNRANTPPEVLLVAFLSAMSHITSHVLGIFNMQSKVRLVSTGFYAVCFMGSIIWSAITFSLDDPARQGLLRFPTVCIIGYIPHVLVLGGIWVCCTIYALALLLTAASPPEVPNGTLGGSSAANADADADAARDREEENRRFPFVARIRRAHANMQANVSLSDIRITMEMDFYTALLRAGFGAITMASEAVYLNEDRRVNLRRFTWLEDERIREMERLRMQWIPGSRYDSNGAIGLVPVVVAQQQQHPLERGGHHHNHNHNHNHRQQQQQQHYGVTSGYSRERAAQKVAKTRTGERVRPIRDGVGAAERSGRWLMALEYLMHINRLVVMSLALACCRLLARLGVATPPRLLAYLAQLPNKRRGAGGAARDGKGGGAGESDMSGDGGDDYDGGVPGGRGGRLRGEWMHGSSGTAYVPRDETVDVEGVVVRQLPGEKDASRTMYMWWLRGGWWGDVDGSGDYQPPAAEGEDPDFDATSVISSTETRADDDDEDENGDGWESDGDGGGFGFVDKDEDHHYSLDEGQRTPTQRNPFASPTSPSRSSSRESSPLVDQPLAMSDLARLLHPASPEEQEEARALAAHLASDGIMTRSRYARFAARRRAQVLLPAGGVRQRMHHVGGGGRGVHHHRNQQKMTAEEEAELLEQILLSRRAQGQGGGGGGSGSAPTSSPSTTTWATGAPGLGPDGPQCVVCQSASRTIIVWPCRCLSLCDDCRVSLAMNNFDKCVCCRREVISFSRIFVP